MQAAKLRGISETDIVLVCDKQRIRNYSGSETTALP
jgi:hypothetical protein